MPFPTPIKKWAAAVAMAGSGLYDIATGSRARHRVGVDRRPLIVLGAVIMNRRALTMRIPAFLVLAVVAIEPEALPGRRFQLPFAAVAALVAVMESRIAALDVDPDPTRCPCVARTRPPVFRSPFHRKAAGASSPICSSRPRPPPCSWPITSPCVFVALLQAPAGDGIAAISTA